jgi:hypothetical protein
LDVLKGGEFDRDVQQWWLVKTEASSRALEIFWHEGNDRGIAASKHLINVPAVNPCRDFSILQFQWNFCVTNPIIDLPPPQPQKHPHKHTSKSASANTAANASSSPNPH